MRQMPLFVTPGPLFPWESPAEALAGPPAGAPSGSPSAEGDGDGDWDEAEAPTGPARERLCKQFEEFMREMRWPYVAVDEAKRAVLGGASIPSFDFLVYSASGPNLLVLLVAGPEPVPPGALDSMREWESAFGKDFRAAFVCDAGPCWTCRMMPGPDGIMEERILNDLV
jgi:hypothetical protein